MSEPDHHGEEIFSSKVAAGSRTYFVDLLRAAPGDKYLKISESRERQQGTHEHDRVMVFEEHLPEFLHALTEAVPFMRHTPPPSAIEALRKAQPRAYAKWTVEEDARLRGMFGGGKSPDEIAGALQRQRGAVQSRLRKLGLLAQGSGWLARTVGRRSEQAR